MALAHFASHIDKVFNARNRLLPQKLASYHGVFPTSSENTGILLQAHR